MTEVAMPGNCGQEQYGRRASTQETGIQALKAWLSVVSFVYRKLRSISKPLGVNHLSKMS
jgi:hypothetical protein